MFELHVSDADISSGSIQVSWCLDKELLKELADAGISDPVIVLVSAPTGTSYAKSKEQRQIVPLKDMVSYVSFNTAGENRIYGFISYLTKKEASNYFLGKYDRAYENNILTYSGDEYRPTLDSKFTSQPLVVSVPEKCFAPKPAQWEQQWVNHFFHDKVVDQCQYRKRRIFAYTIQPLVLFFMSIPKLIPLFITFLIADRTFFQAIHRFLHPLTYSLSDNFDDFGGSALMYSWPSMEEDYERVRTVPSWIFYLLKRIHRLPLMPIFLIAMFILFHFHKFFVAGIVLAVIAIIFTMAIGITWALDAKLFSRIFSFFQRSFFPEAGTFWYQDDEAEQLLICSSEKKPLTVSSLPRKYRSIRLRFQQAKNSVCRPFSR